MYKSMCAHLHPAILASREGKSDKQMCTIECRISRQKRAKAGPPKKQELRRWRWDLDVEAQTAWVCGVVFRRERVQFAVRSDRHQTWEVCWW